MSASEFLTTRSLSPMPVNSNSGSALFHQVQIRPRDTFKFFVRADQPLDTLHFAFYTRKKNIAFGLFYLHLPSIDGQESSSLPIAKVRELLASSRENVKIDKVGQEGSLARTLSSANSPSKLNTSRYLLCFFI